MAIPSFQPAMGMCIVHLRTTPEPPQVCTHLIMSANQLDYFIMHLPMKTMNEIALALVASSSYVTVDNAKHYSKEVMLFINICLFNCWIIFLIQKADVNNVKCMYVSC